MMEKARFHDRLKEELYGIELIDLDIAASEFAGIYLTTSKRIKTKNYQYGKKVQFHLKKHYGILIDLDECIDNNGFYTFILPDYHVDITLLKNDECKKAFIRGVFITSGRVNDLDKALLLEISFKDKELMELTKGLIESFDMKMSYRQRSNRHILYLKKMDRISDFLSLISASRSLLEFENARIIREIWNNTLRAVNFETANIGKTSAASRRQEAAIRFLIEQGKLYSLPNYLFETANLRLNFPDSSLQELSQMLKPPISKAGIAHRLNKLIDLAKEYGYEI